MEKGGEIKFARDGSMFLRRRHMYLRIRASTRPNSQSKRRERKIFSDSPYVSMGWYPLLGFLLTQHMD